jgi:hypothetical protein
MSNKHLREYKPDSSVSDKITEDLLSDLKRYGPFWRYKRIVKPDNESENEVCSECGKIHNNVALRTYDDIETSMDDIPNLFFGRKRILIDKEVS